MCRAFGEKFQQVRVTFETIIDRKLMIHVLGFLKMIPIFFRTDSQKTDDCSCAVLGLAVATGTSQFIFEIQPKYEVLLDTTSYIAALRCT